MGVASMKSTSCYAVQRICKKVDGSVRRVIVEYGPGTGGVAEELLKEGKLTPDSSLTLIEKDPRLAAHLKRSMHDPRVRVVHDSAENVRQIMQETGGEKADYVLLSIPLTTMTADTRARILTATRDILKDDGRLIAFLFHPATPGYIRTHFPQMNIQWEPRNFPPLILMEAGK